MQTKVNHYVNNLAQVAQISDCHKSLLEKVEQVKNDVSFVIFCEHHFDNGNQTVDIIDKYFLINK